MSLSIRTARAMALLGVAVALAGAIGGTTTACSEKGIASPCPPGETCQTRLTLFHTADIHSRLLPYDLLITQVDSDLGLGQVGEVRNVGGVARMAYVLRRERARAERSLHLSGGDCFQGAPIFNFFGGEPEMRAQGMLGVDAMAIANHEFDKGPLNVAIQAQKWASFPVLAANYKLDDVKLPNSTPLGSVILPFTTFNVEGLKVGVVGMGNLSSLTSIFDQPNKLGVTPINTTEVAQFYIDLLRPLVDVVVFTTHLGLDVDQRMIRETTGIDVVLGSHNHIVLNPPQIIRDCQADPQNPGFVWVLDPDAAFDTNKAPPNDADHPDPINHPFQKKRRCTPRNVLLAHSGAFAKYVGRLDLVLSNTPAEASVTGNADDYDPINKFEVISNRYTAFPINDRIPEDPALVEMLQPYRRKLDYVADLDLLVGFSPFGAKRNAPQGGDSPLGNLIASANWLRLGVQTDFSMTNSTGIRQDLLPGPVTVEEMYNIFPFDNSITKMQLSGIEVMEMFDFIARRSASRGCTSQAQIAGARVVLNCAGCTRTTFRPFCDTDADCPTQTRGECDTSAHLCNLTSCAENVYIDFTKTPCNADTDCLDADGNPMRASCSTTGPGTKPCSSDADCGSAAGSCNTTLKLCKPGVCMAPIIATNLYELATSNYLASGGSGFRVLQRNTTQFDTKIQQRDALIDYVRAGHPCGWVSSKVDPNRASDGLLPCTTDGDCPGAFVCACPGNSEMMGSSPFACKTTGTCDGNSGRCVRADCRDAVANFRDRRCATSPDADACRVKLDPCQIGGESCKILSCVDESLGAATDNRVQMLGH
jgi:5'-nucleotidase